MVFALWAIIWLYVGKTTYIVLCACLDVCVHVMAHWENKNSKPWSMGRAHLRPRVPFGAFLHSIEWHSHNKNENRELSGLGGLFVCFRLLVHWRETRRTVSPVAKQRKVGVWEAKEGGDGGMAEKNTNNKRTNSRLIHPSIPAQCSMC